MALAPGSGRGSSLWLCRGRESGVSQISPDNRLPDWEGVAALCKSTDGRSLLMVLQGRSGEEPSWAVPGGSIEPGETPERAAIREVREETGLEVRNSLIHRVAWVSADRLRDLRLSHEDQRQILMEFMDEQ
jgi:ADP-ribose pyrophosphatase YjhB (NUDIX family)